MSPLKCPYMTPLPKCREGRSTHVLVVLVELDLVVDSVDVADALRVARELRHVLYHPLHHLHVALPERRHQTRHLVGGRDSKHGLLPVLFLYFLFLYLFCLFVVSFFFFFYFLCFGRTYACEATCHITRRFSSDNSHSGTDSLWQWATQVFQSW